jgi:hypothetical protein
MGKVDQENGVGASISLANPLYPQYFPVDIEGAIPADPHAGSRRQGEESP